MQEQRLGGTCEPCRAGGGRGAGVPASWGSVPGEGRALEQMFGQERMSVGARSAAQPYSGPKGRLLQAQDQWGSAQGPRSLCLGLGPCGAGSQRGKAHGTRSQPAFPPRPAASCTKLLLTARPKRGLSAASPTPQHAARQLRGSGRGWSLDEAPRSTPGPVVWRPAPLAPRAPTHPVPAGRAVGGPGRGLRPHKPQLVQQCGRYLLLPGSIQDPGNVPPLLRVPRCLRSAARSPHGAPVPGSQSGHWGAEITSKTRHFCHRHQATPAPGVAHLPSLGHSLPPLLLSFTSAPKTTPCRAPV